MGLPLHVFAWQPLMRRAGLERAALYVIRRDGYVGFADARGDLKRLRQYWTNAVVAGGDQRPEVRHA